jgi:thioredoxin-like negative regulator of GroEL
MIGSALGLLLQAAIVASGAQPYSKAYEECQAKNQPLLILVGAEWCPACQVMKQDVLTRMTDDGRLGKVSYAVIDSDEHPEMAGQLMRGNSVPQLIIYSKRPDGQWYRDQLTGRADELAVEGLITRAIEQQVDRQAKVETPGGK